MDLREAGGLTTIAGVELREDTVGDPTEIGEIWLREASGLILLWSAASPIELNVTPEVTGAAAFPEPIGVVTTTATVTIVGGIAPYGIVWTRTDAGPGIWQVMSQGQLATAFRAVAVPPGETRTATFSCTVTDDRGNSAVSDDVDATATNFGSLGTPP